ncbi:MAG TPA: lipid II flippase MurJ [Actinomycetota bacterium]
MTESVREAAAAPEEPSVAVLARATLGMTALTALSRATGFARVLVVAAVLGPTFLGNTYQSANTVPNLLFELLAAGALQAVLIPTLVEVLDTAGRDEVSRVAGSVLGLAATVLGVVAGLGMIASPWIMRGLVSGVADPAVRDAQVRLGTVFLLFFLPQVAFYAAGMVGTAVLNAQERFALPAFAPVVNNVVVIGAYAGFWALRGGAAPSLELRAIEIAVLAGGTTLGVMAFTLVPVVAAVRSGVSLRPRLDLRHAAVRRIGRQGVWAAVYVGSTQVLLAAALVLANRVEGGVVTYHVAYTFFLLPHALISVPIATALFPRLSRRARDGRGFGATLGAGARATGVLTVVAAVAVVVLARPLAGLALFGRAGAHAGEVARVLTGFAPAIVGYGLFVLLTRAFYATGDARTPAIVNALVAAAGSAAMAVGFARGAIPALAWSFSGAQLAGAGALALLLWRSRAGKPDAS